MRPLSACVSLGLRQEVQFAQRSVLNAFRYLDKVEIIDVGEQRTYEFHCERWLSPSREDRKMEREVFERGYKGDRGGSASALDVGSLGASHASEPFGAQQKQRDQRPVGPSMISDFGHTVLVFCVPVFYCAFDYYEVFI